MVLLSSPFFSRPRLHRPFCGRAESRRRLNPPPRCECKGKIACVFEPPSLLATKRFEGRVCTSCHLMAAVCTSDAIEEGEAVA